MRAEGTRRTMSKTASASRRRDSRRAARSRAGADALRGRRTSRKRRRRTDRTRRIVSGTVEPRRTMSAAVRKRRTMSADRRRAARSRSAEVDRWGRRTNRKQRRRQAAVRACPIMSKTIEMRRTAPQTVGHRRSSTQPFRCRRTTRDRGAPVAEERRLPARRCSRPPPAAPPRRTASCG